MMNCHSKDSEVNLSSTYFYVLIIFKSNIKGKISSLLEVGTGFHPEMTGRENIYITKLAFQYKHKPILRL